MKKLVATEPVKAGGKRYAPGDALEVDDAVAEWLLSIGHAAEGGGKKKAAPAPAEPDKPQA